MTFENQDVQIEFFSPNLETFSGEQRVVTVGDGVETSVASTEPNEDNIFSAGYNIDITDSSIIYESIPLTPKDDNLTIES